MRLLTFLLLSTLAALSSCGNDEDLPKAWDQYFPAQRGDWQIFRHITLGPTGDTVAIRYDSIHYVESISYNGQESALLGVVHLQGSNIPRDTAYFAVKDNGAYTFLSPASFEGFSDFVFDRQWIRFGSFNDDDTSWVTLDTALTDVPFRIGTETINGSGTVKQTYRYTRETPVIVLANDDKTPVYTREFISTTRFEFTVMIDGQQVPVIFENIERLYFAKGRGLVRHFREAYSVNLNGDSVTVNGFELLLRSNHAN